MKLFYSVDRQEWRRYLEDHFETDDEVWFVFPTKESGEESMSYNDAVEEALALAGSTAPSSIRMNFTAPSASHPEKKEVHIHSRISKD